MDKVEVSVIIPFLNASQWLLEAVSSVKNQTFTNWELLMIDDGSSPEHSSVAQSLVDNEKIFYLDHLGHQNCGVSVSRNLGALHAQGRYLAFLDADDYWLPDKLMKQLYMFKENPSASMVCESSLFWHSWQHSIEPDHIVEVGASPNTIYRAPDLLTILYPLGEGAPPCPTGIMVTKKSFEKVDGFETSFVGELQLYEDQGFLTKMYLSETIFVSAECNNKYRKHAGSITESANDPKVYRKSRLHFLNWFERYSSPKNLPVIQEAIANARATLDQ